MSRQLHSEHLEICRVCLRKPETDRNINFLDIYMPLNDGKTLKEYLKELLNIIVEPNDRKPNLLCEVCYIKMDKIKEKKKKQAESRITINYLYSKKPSHEKRSASFKAKYIDAINHNRTIDEPEFLSEAFSNNKENSEFISNSNQTTTRKKLRRVRKESSTDEDESNESNKPRYCLCNDVEYGRMVACDDKKCPHEWFHYKCVGITKKPLGAWYCPLCISKLER